jgi:hypothetical protein
LSNLRLYFVRKSENTCKFKSDDCPGELTHSVIDGLISIAGVIFSLLGVFAYFIVITGRLPTFSKKAK